MTKDLPGFGNLAGLFETGYFYLKVTSFKSSLFHPLKYPKISATNYFLISFEGIVSFIQKHFQ